MRRLLFSLLAASFLYCADFPKTNFAKEGDRWWSHIQVLAADGMQGRNTGSEGHRRAAQFVAGEFERAGLKPAGVNGYIQPVEFNVAQIVEGQSSLALVRDGKATSAAAGTRCDAQCSRGIG